MRTLTRFAFMPFLCAIALATTSCSKDEAKEDGKSGPTRGTVGGHEWVDLGLPSGTLWATCDLNAKYALHDKERFYPWGYTEFGSIRWCSWGDQDCDYEFCGFDFETLRSKGVIDANGNLTAEYDAATTNWGSDWRMPTKEECEELIANCDWHYEERKLTSKRNSEELAINRNTGGNGSRDDSYWSCTFDGAENKPYAFSFFREGDVYTSEGCWARWIRPVLKNK